MGAVQPGGNAEVGQWQQSSSSAMRLQHQPRAWQARLEYDQDRPTMLQQQRHTPSHKMHPKTWSMHNPSAPAPSPRTEGCGMMLSGHVQADARESLLSRAALPNKDPKVFLHVYSLGTSGEGKVLNSVLGLLGTGAFHCGVEVYGKEWSFRGRCCSGTGVFASRPSCCDNHTYIETIPMGESLLTPPEVSRVLSILQREWPGTSYDTLRRNCCHFSDKLCRCLGVGRIPSKLLNLADTGLYLVETSNAIDLRRQSLVKQFSETFICDHTVDKDAKVVEYDLPAGLGF